MKEHLTLVTGASGHIGNVLVRQLLSQGKAVRVLTLPGEDISSLAGLNVEQVQGDVLDETSLEAGFSGVQSVFHLAGIISIMPGANPLVRRVNVQGTLNVLKMSLRHKINKLIYTSSIHALARIPPGKTIDEQLPFDPHNPYGAYDQSKAEATLLVKEAAHHGLNAVIACPTGVIGPYDYRQSMMGAVIRSAAERQPTPYVEGAYDFVDVRDVASGLLAAEEKGRTGTSYILSGQRISVRYLLETVREITGKDFIHFKIPLSLAKIASKITPLYYRLSHSIPRFTPYSLEVLQSNSVISHSKATHELGYHPRPLYESIRDTISWFLEQKPHNSQQG